MNRKGFIIAASLMTTAAVMFRSFFKKPIITDDHSFRDRVLKLLKVSFPNIQFAAPAQDADVIVAKGTQIGLQNLKAKFDLSDRTEQTLEQLVNEHFKFVLEKEPQLPDFDSGYLKLKPQIMPPEYAQQAPIISFPLGQTLAVGIVFDSDRGYLYLGREDALRWNKSDKELLDLAIANLNEASHDIQMQSSANEEAKWIGIETKDGFDAARILIPKFREFLASRLGTPFRFGIPNRDFLVCWNTGSSTRFSEFTASKIQKDFDTQPYPLSPHIFEVTDDGIITELA